MAYEKTVYVSFDNNRQMQDLFSTDMKIERIITGLELYCGHKIAPKDTLLIFDEIQEAPKALTALKYYYYVGGMPEVVSSFAQNRDFNEARHIQQQILMAYEQDFKDALTEQHILQQLKTLSSIETYYWTNDRGSAELDFLIDAGERIVPIEVKAETNLKAKSLKTYYDKYVPEVSVRTAMTDYKREE